MRVALDIQRETDGRWLADIPLVPGCMAYGQTKEQAEAKVQQLFLQIIEDRLAHNC